MTALKYVVWNCLKTGQTALVALNRLPDGTIFPQSALSQPTRSLCVGPGMVSTAIAIGCYVQHDKRILDVAQGILAKSQRLVEDPGNSVSLLIAMRIFVSQRAINTSLSSFKFESAPLVFVFKYLNSFRAPGLQITSEDFLGFLD